VEASIFSMQDVFN